MFLIVVPPLASIACRIAQLGPVAGLVAGALVELRVYKGLHHDDAVAMYLLPVIIEPLRAKLHNPRGEVRNFCGLHPQQEPTIGCQQTQSRATPIILPANPFIPAFKVVGGGAPAEQSQPLAAIFGYMADYLSGYPMAVQVMLCLYQFVESYTFGLRVDAPYRYMIKHIPFVEFWFSHAHECGQADGMCPEY